MEKNNNSKDIHLETDNQDNNQQYGNYNQPNGQYNNQQYGNYNQQDVQFGNQQNQNNVPYNTTTNNISSNKNNKKLIIISSIAAVLLIVVAAIFMFFNNQEGASSPEGAVQGFIDAFKKDDYVKANNYIYYSSKEERKEKDEKIEKLLKEDKTNILKLSVVDRVKNTKIVEVKEKSDTEARVRVSIDDSSTVSVTVKKIDGRWYLNNAFPF